MRVSALLTDRKAVSPVIGVILMVAITVVVAAVTGGLVVGLGSDTDRVPTATFGFSYVERSGSPDEVTIDFESGDVIGNDRLYVSGEGFQIQEESGSPGPADRLNWAELTDDGTTVESGDSVMVEPPNADPEIEGRTLQIVWDPGPDGDGPPSVIYTWTAPG